MIDHVVDGWVGRPGRVLGRRAARVVALALGGLVVGTQFGSPVSGYGLLLAAVLGGALGVESGRRDGYTFYGNLLLGTILGPLLAWLVAGIFPTLYLDVSVFSATVATSVRTGASVYPVVLSFYAGLFGGMLVASAARRLDAPRGVALAAGGLAIYTAAHLVLAGLRPSLGERAIRPLAEQGGRARLYELLKLVGGLATFGGVAAVAAAVDYDRVLLAGVVAGVAFAGAGLGTSHAAVSAALTAEDVAGAAETEVTGVRVADGELRFAATVRNPTDTRVVVEAGFMRAFQGGDQLAYGPLVVESDGGSVVVPPGGSATVEVAMRTSDDQAATTSDALRSGEVRLAGRLSASIAGQRASIPFEATAG